MHSIIVTKLFLFGIFASVNVNASGNCISIDPSRDYPCIPYEYIPENEPKYGYIGQTLHNNETQPAEDEVPQYRTIIPENIDTMDTHYVQYEPEPYDAWSPISNSEQHPYLNQHLEHGSQSEAKYRYENKEETPEPIDPKYSYEIQSPHLRSPPPPPPATTYIIPAETPIAKAYPHDEIFYYNYNSAPPVVPEAFTIQIKKPILHRRHFRPQRPTAHPPFAFPSSPFPGWSGIYSPNPGYLVKQRFQVYRRPAYMPYAKKSLWQKALG